MARAGRIACEVHEEAEVAEEREHEVRGLSRQHGPQEVREELQDGCVGIDEDVVHEWGQRWRRCWVGLTGCW